MDANKLEELKQRIQKALAQHPLQTVSVPARDLLDLVEQLEETQSDNKHLEMELDETINEVVELQRECERLEGELVEMGEHVV